MVNAGALKSSKRFSGIPRTRVDGQRRARLLAAFDRSGLSAAAFARRQKLNYTTFCGWRHRRTKSKARPAFVEVELPGPAMVGPVTIELGKVARLTMTSAGQIGLVAALIQALNPKSAC